MTVELAIAGLTGGIHKMLVVPGHDLYDVDACIDQEFGEDDSDDDSVYRQGGLQYNASTDSTEAESMNIDEEKQQHEQKNIQQKDMRESNGQDNKGCIIQPSAAEVAVISLDPDTDPFAPRSGKTLLWRNVNMTLVCIFYRRYNVRSLPILILFVIVTIF
jgi:hypothetical protein